MREFYVVICKETQPPASEIFHSPGSPFFIVGEKVSNVSHGIGRNVYFLLLFSFSLCYNVKNRPVSKGEK